MVESARFFVRQVLFNFIWSYAEPWMMSICLLDFYVWRWIKRVTCFACHRRLGLHSLLSTVSTVPVLAHRGCGLPRLWVHRAHSSQQAAQRLGVHGREGLRWVSVLEEQRVSQKGGTAKRGKIRMDPNVSIKREQIRMDPNGSVILIFRADLFSPSAVCNAICGGFYLGWGSAAECLLP